VECQRAAIPIVNNQNRREGPLSISAIGLYMLFGACLMPINIFMHAPAFLMGFDFRGWEATSFFSGARNARCGPRDWIAEARAVEPDSGDLFLPV